MADKDSGRKGVSECRSSQRLPSGKIAEGSKSGSTQPSGGGTRSRDMDTKAQPNQSLPSGFNDGGQGDYHPSKPLTSRDYHGVRAQPTQKLPSTHFDETNVSQGKSVGATRGADAYQGPRTEQSDPTPRKPGG